MTFRIHKFRLRHRNLAGLLIAALIITQSGCAGNDSNLAVSSGEDFLLNTYCSITIYEEGKEDLIKDAFSYARSLENMLSRTVAGSEVSAFNSMSPGDKLEISETTAAVVERGLAYGQTSGGLFDITIGSLTELWNFSAAQPVVPGSDAIEAALLPVGYLTVAFMRDPETGAFLLAKQNPATHIDLGGIAKGYIADMVAAFLQESGVASGIVNFGGNVMTIGSKADGSPWVIGVEKPFSGEEGEPLGTRELIGTVSVAGGSVVTSGTYERKFFEEGKLYYHILDPGTGYPRETDLMSVTIIGASSADCDALSTICLMMGLDQGTALIESMQGYEAIFITEDGTISFTEGAGFTAY